ncbi:MAG: CBS domain-containing protein, partial [Bacteroidia bacterium]|nr:CBS domain-containing protein [Bacteroidia bacterium]
LYNPFLVLIGAFVFFGAYSENMLVQQMEFLRGHLVAEAMMTSFSRLAPTDTVALAADWLLAGCETSFLVVDHDKVLGAVSRSAIIEALRQQQPDLPVERIMEPVTETFSPQQKLSKVYHKFYRNGSTVYPVVEDNTLKGLINLENVQEFVMVQSALRY